MFVFYLFATIVLSLPVDLDYATFNWYVADRKSHEMLSEKPWFVKFYAPWCTHCKQLEPILNDFYLQNNDKVNVGTVDCTTLDGSPLCIEYGI
jgi:thiol-disulfide isomerase/thioredoxin